MLAADQVRDLAISHHSHVDDVAHGRATIETAWEMAGAALGWSRIAQQLGQGETEMAQDLHVIRALIDRWQRTGRVAYTGIEYQQAKAGLEVADQLARLTDLITARAAVDWAENRINVLRSTGNTAALARLD